MRCIKRIAMKTFFLLLVFTACNFVNGFRPLKTSQQRHLNFRDFRSDSQHNSLKKPVRPTITAVAVKTSTSKAALDQEPIADNKDLKITVGWFAAAVAFAGVIYQMKGYDAAIAFCAGYLLEQCLSVDNLIVFLVLFDYFQIDKNMQSKVLNYGIFGAVILRGIFIAAGSVALSKFKQVTIVFAVVLLFSSYKILSGNDEEEEDMADNAVLNFAKKYLRTSQEMDGDKFFTVENGVSLATPLMLCLVCVEASDIVFAFDSVPAIFGVTSDPFVVFTSNMFAIAGLRSLFGVLSQAVQDLKYLEKAVGVVLAIIAAKLAGSGVGIELLTPLQSLMVVVATLGVGIGASIFDPFNDTTKVQDP